MISGNCNRSPQYTNAMGMGPPGGAQRYNPQSFIQQQQQQQHPHLLFMAGGSVRAFPQMSRGFSMMPSRGGVGGAQGCHPIVQCSMQNGFGNYGYHTTPSPMFQQRHHHLYPQPQVIHHQQQHHPQYIPQHYIAPPPAAGNRTEPTSGFINGIKNMVKGIINPLNCDFYADHHKYYNPKYRNNYMRDMKSENLSYKPPPHQPEPHVQAVVVGLEMNKPAAPKMEEKPKQSSQDCPKKNPTPEVVAIFSSEDFPELPAPRRSRSATPAKTETTSPTKQTEVGVVNNDKENEAPSSVAICQQHPPAKGTFFEIMCTTVPRGRRPTFGGRLKVVPPPFSLNKSPQSFCRRRQESNSDNTSTINEDCDIEEDSFVIFPNTKDKSEQCVFASVGRRPPRQRQISECSDDSFVVFFTEDADCLGGLECVDDDDDDEDDDSDDDSDDDTSSEEEDSFYDSEDEDDDDEEEEDQENGFDCVDSGFSGTQNKTDRNKCENEANTTKPLCSQQIPSCNGIVPREHKQLDSGFDEKKVTFDPQPVVHVMRAWNYAYRSARKGHWEDFARDRERFQKRIERTSVYLNPVLTPEHRENIYHSRFNDDVTNQTQQQQQQKSSNPTRLDIVGSLLHQASASRSDDNQRIPKLAKLPNCANF